MIDLISNFEREEKNISDYVQARTSGYQTSRCFQALDRRLNDLELSNDLKPASLRRNEFNSKVVFPIVKERALLRRAITAANYRAPEIYALSPIGSTPPENAAHAELVLNLNMEHTFFRMRCLKPLIGTAAKFGTAVSFTYWKKQDSPKLETIYNPKTGMYKRERVRNLHKNAFTEEVSLRDYVQNPDIADPDQSDFQGHWKRLHISELQVLLADDTYIRENLIKAIDEAKKGVIKSTRKPYAEKDEKRWGVDVFHFEGTVNIKGNEEDDCVYMLDMVGPHIIRMSRENYDDDIRSYTVLNFDKRHDFWWGNADSEYVVAHENFLNIMLSMTADQALRSMQQYVFFKGGTISPSDLNNRARNNGFIPVDAKEVPLSQLIMPFQPGQLNYGAVEYAVNAVNESAQKMSTKVDLSRQQQQGGLANKTATAANIIAGQSDVLEADIMENFDFGVCGIGRRSLIMLQQFLSELFYVRPRPEDVEKQLRKYEILGRYGYQTNSTMMKNRQGELLRLQNLVTWWLNISQNPLLAQAGVNILPIVKEVWNKADIPSDEVMPSENKQAGVPGMVQSAQAPAQQSAGGMMPGGMPLLAAPGGGVPAMTGAM